MKYLIIMMTTMIAIMWITESTNGAAIVSVEKLELEQDPNLVHDDENSGTKPKQALEEERSLFADFYRNKTQPSAGELPGGDESDDFGDAFTHTALKAAVALADTGLQAMQQILKTTGVEILEAIRMKREADE